VAHGGTEPAPSNDSLEALRRLKTTETEAETKVHALVAEGNERLKQLRESAEGEVLAAKVAAEKAADAAIEAARERLTSELESVIKTGENEAGIVALRGKAELTKVRAKLLDAILAGFRSD
jgi:vacuolar-type H+-ATPase subunit H